MVKIGESYGPYNSGGGATWQQDKWQQVMQVISRDGVINTLNLAAVTADTGMHVKVDTGVIWGGGVWYKNDASKQITITTADATHNRIDLIIVRFDLTGKTAAAQVLTGTAAASPTVPSMTHDTSTWDVPLAQVLVHANDTAGSQFTITDRRRLLDVGDDVVYGLSNGVIAPQIWTPNGDATSSAKVYIGGGFGNNGAGVEVHGQMDHKGSLAEFLQTSPGQGSSPGLLTLGGQPSFDMLMQLGNMSVFSGTGHTTHAAHGLGKTPDIIIISGTSGSDEFWYNNLTSTDVEIHSANGTSWTALAIKNG